MEISHRAGYLVSSYDPESKTSRVRVVPTLSEVVASWDGATRLSPLYAVTGTDITVSPDAPLNGSLWLVFCGPINPAAIAEIPAGVSIWATLGTFNVIARAPTEAAANAFSAQVADTASSYEIWSLVDGVVTVVKHSASNLPAPVPTSLANLAALSGIPHELHTSISEYCALMASSLSRTRQALPELVNDLLSIHEFALRATQTPDLEARHNLYRTLGIFAHLNAGLSRFCAQTLSGISPVLQTECHFWIHSLLGTGIANLALHRFASYVVSKIDNKCIPARLRALAGRTDSLPHLDTVAPDFWHENHLESVIALPEAQAQTQLPLLTYFSGRDGFRSGLNTVSAPLASIGACNARQWSLMTMTHEISHIVVRSILAVILADPKRPAGTEILDRFLRNNSPTWLSRIQEFLLDTVIAMHQNVERATGAKVTTDWDARKLTAVLDRWHHEVEEISVHVFDFLYFYGQDTERYVRGIWTTWGVIPNISNRVTEYVIRTMCVALVRHLRRDKAEDIARSEVLEILTQLQTPRAGTYVHQACELLSDDAQWSSIRSAIVSRKGLIKIVRGFLYWDTAAQDVRGDVTVTSNASERGGYRLKVGQLSTDSVENPLRVIEEYTDSLHPSELTSAWLLYALAFNVEAAR